MHRGKSLRYHTVVRLLVISKVSIAISFRAKKSINVKLTKNGKVLTCW